MNEEQINKIINQTENFYQQNAEEFSKTRKNPWNGWKYLLSIVNEEFADKDLISVLDLGCGNARFYQYLEENLEFKIDYLGLDTNDFMMIEAILKHPRQKFKKLNIIKNIKNIDQKFDLVVAFGLTHHLPGNEFRKKWFESVLKLVQKNGLLFLTFWNLQTDPRFEKAQRANDLEKNDCYYNWGNSNEKRYVHIYDKSEILKLSELFKNNGFKLLKTFDSDGKNGKMNTYLILKAIL